MLIITTIYCTELEPAPQLSMDQSAEAPKQSDLEREFVSIYQGRNRVLPTNESE